MNILFIHPDYPGQFRYLAAAFGAKSENRVIFVTGNARSEWDIKGVEKFGYREPAVDSLPTARVREYEKATRTGITVAELLHDLRSREGFTPDIIYGYAGAGVTMFVREVYPQAPWLGYFDWFYNLSGSNIGFDPEVPANFGTAVNTSIRNAPILSDLLACDHGIVPTAWQKKQFPREFAHKLTELHDGIDTGFFQPQPDQGMSIPGLDLSGVEKIVTYAARGMEPYRGFPQFIEALPVILRQEPKCHIVIAGLDRVFYSPQRSDGKTYREYMLGQVDLDQERVHFVGNLSIQDYRTFLQASSVHVHLTYPFVPSRTLLEAMACGCSIIASDTAPVREFVRDGENGVLVDFFSPADIANKVIAGLTFPAHTKGLRSRARQTIEDNYALDDLLPRHLEIIEQLAAGPVTGE